MEDQVGMKANIRYSEAFKLQVVREVEQGRFESGWAAGRAYGVKGAGTVATWIQRYGKDHLLGKVVKVMKADEQTEVKALRKRVRELERALADAHIDLKLEEAYLEIACEAAGVQDVAEFKKKRAMVRSTKS
jgi:transposase-like protein